MSVVAAIGGALLIVLILLDGFETMVLPRRVMRTLRLARYFYRSTWWPLRWLALRMPPGKKRETLLSAFGPASILGLFGTWAAGLIVGFALLHWSLGGPLKDAQPPSGFLNYIYMSGLLFFTLGYGDLLPTTGAGRALGMIEGGIGFGFMAVIIGYLPVLYTSFSARELQVALLDARAGSPPTAGELLLRAARSGKANALEPLLAQWEQWSATLLETSLSFPVTCFYRSQHDNQSWLAALSMILDSSAILATGIDGIDAYQPRLTFAMSRHALVDLAMVFHTPPCETCSERLSAEAFINLRTMLSEAGMQLPADAESKLRELRAMYEPFLYALGEFFVFKVPPFVRDGRPTDNWQTSAWMRRMRPLDQLGAAPSDEHFA